MKKINKQQIIEVMKESQKYQNLGQINGIPVCPCWQDPEHEDCCLALCPICSRLHRHGLRQDKNLHHKISHCWSGVVKNSGYYIQLQPEPIPEIILTANKIWSKVWNRRFQEGLLRSNTTASEILNRVRVNACN